MMRKLLLPLRLLYCFYAFCTFFLCMLLVVPVVIGGSFFGKIKGGNFIYRICCYWGDVWFFLIGIRHRNRREAEHGKSEQYIYVANHISYLDAPLIVKTIRKPLRVLGKVEMAKIPVFGYIYRNAIVTVDRSSAENRKSITVITTILAPSGATIIRSCCPSLLVPSSAYLGEGLASGSLLEVFSLPFCKSSLISPSSICLQAIRHLAWRVRTS